MDSWDIQSLFRISFKTRLDGYTDQYNRILMVKVLLVCAFIMGINWYEDKINCIIPVPHINSKEFVYFVESACWMQGLYVYKEMRSRMNISAFYGMPIYINYDGLEAKSFPCNSKSFRDDLETSHRHFNAVQTCIPMKKTFYLQYQWMPFYIGTLSFLYYLPFMIFRITNSDLVCLEDDAESLNSKAIVKRYFHDLGVTTDKKNNLKFITRIAMKVFIKLLYLAVNIGALVASDKLLDGEFLNYVPKWIHWSKFNNSISFDYMGARNFPKPGNELLPPFGYCEVYSSSTDERYTYVNKHKLVCELSQHILYQYIFVLLWITIVVGLAISMIGVLVSLANCIISCRKFRKKEDRISWKKFSKYLTYRHREYLELLKRNHINLYDEVVFNMDVIATKSNEPVVSTLPDTIKVEFSGCNGDVKRRTRIHETEA